MPKPHGSVEGQFWDTVFDNKLSDAWVPVAAEDPRLEAAVRLGYGPDVHDGKLDDEYERRVRKVAREYGLVDQGQAYEMMNLCENDMREQYGNQT